MIFGWTSASACLNAESPKTVLFSAKTISSAFTTPKRSLSLSLSSYTYIHMRVSIYAAITITESFDHSTFISVKP